MYCGNYVRISKYNPYLMKSIQCAKLMIYFKKVPILCISKQEYGLIVKVLRWAKGWMQEKQKVMGERVKIERD